MQTSQVETLKKKKVIFNTQSDIWHQVLQFLQNNLELIWHSYFSVTLYYLKVRKKRGLHSVVLHGSFSITQCCIFQNTVIFETDSKLCIDLRRCKIQMGRLFGELLIVLLKLEGQLKAFSRCIPLIGLKEKPTVPLMCLLLGL